MVFYYYNKFQDSEMEYLSLHKKFDQVYTENQKIKTRLKDLQYYKNDVSKTFKILDKELEQISDHINKQNPVLVENESLYQNQNREELQMENVQTHTLPYSTVESNVQGNPPIREPLRRNTINPMRTIRRTVTTPIGPISTIYTLPIQQGMLGQLGDHSFQRDSINPIVITPDILTSLFSTMNPTNTSNDTFTNGVDIRQGTFTNGVDIRQGTFTNGVDTQQGTFTNGVDTQQGTFTNGVDIRQGNTNENENIESQSISASRTNSELNKKKEENNKETNEETKEENNKENVSVLSNDVFITDNIQNSLNEEGNLYDVNYLSSNENYEQYLL
jgi:hypothetical protein